MILNGRVMMMMKWSVVVVAELAFLFIHHHIWCLHFFVLLLLSLLLALLAEALLMLGSTSDFLPPIRKSIALQHLLVKFVRHILTLFLRSTKESLHLVLPLGQGLLHSLRWLQIRERQPVNYSLVPLLIPIESPR